MSLRDLDYQARVLSRLDDYLTELSAHKRKADKIAAANAAETDPDLIRPVPDFPLKTWAAMQASGKLPASRSGIPYSSRDDGIGRAVPPSVGELELVVEDGTRIECDLVLMTEWKTKLPTFI